MGEKCYSIISLHFQIHIVLGHFFGGERLLFSSGDARLTRANLCDSTPDTISISISDEELSLTISDVSYQWRLMFEQSWMLSDADLYIGGLPGMYVLHI